MRALQDFLPLFFALSLFPSGCNWIPGSEEDCKLLLADNDGDGFPLNEPAQAGAEDPCAQLVVVDCDDADPGVHPEAEDAWYDGLDANCVGDDDYDQDGDGWAALGYDKESSLEATDCNDTSSDVSPDQADSWYDGVDSDCGGEDDYDQDGDGYAAAEYKGLSSLPATDCADLDASIHPGQKDPWYDGIDSDCAGNDDFDQDADGFAALGSLGSTLPATDCDDESAGVHPDATETWYDGVDADCAGDDDYDRDADGYAKTGTTGSVLPATDCDDANPNVHPGTLEILGDATDRDCDGGADSFPMESVVDWTFEGLRALSFVQEDSTLALVSLADSVYDLSEDTETSPAGALFLFDAAAPVDGPTRETFWLDSLSAKMALTPGFGVTLFEGEIDFALGASLSGLFELVTRGYDTVTRRVAWSRAGSPAEISGETLEDVALARDSLGNLHAVGCFVQGDLVGADEYPFLVRDRADTFIEPTVSSSPASNLCRLDFHDPGGLGTLILREQSTEGAGALSVYSFTPCTVDPCTLEFEQASTWSELDPELLVVIEAAAGRWLVFYDANTLSIRVSLLEEDSSVWSLTEMWSIDVSGDPPISMDAAMPVADPPPDPERRELFVTWAGISGDIGLAWGVPSEKGTFEETVLDPGIHVELVAIDTVSSTLILAAEGTDELSEGQLLVGYSAAR